LRRAYFVLSNVINDGLTNISQLGTHEFKLKIALNNLGILQRRMHKYNLLIDIEIPSDDVEAAIWRAFDEQINSHCLLHDIILPQNPTAEDDDSDPSNLAWELVTSNNRAHIHTYIPNGTLTRHSFNLKNLSKAPFGSRLPNHHLASSPNVFFLLISEFHTLILIECCSLSFTAGPRYGFVSAIADKVLNKRKYGARHCCLHQQILPDAPSTDCIDGCDTPDDNHPAMRTLTFHDDDQLPESELVCIYPNNFFINGYPSLQPRSTGDIPFDIDDEVCTIDLSSF
jgi:hypothetical protein